MRGWSWWMTLCAAGAMPGCLWGDCSADFQGIRDGERVDTLVVAQRKDNPQLSCGALGDLAPGSTIQWTARLRAPGDGCYDGVQMRDVSTAGLTVNPTMSNVIPVQLASGCRGNWNLSLSYQRSPDAEAETWILRRTFNAMGDAEVCFPMSATPPSSCEDSFVVEHTPR